MRFPVRILSAVVALALAATSCGDSTATAPVAPPAALTQPDSAELFFLLRPTGLLSCAALPEARAEATIGPAGGVLRVGPHVLRVPAGALDRPVTITAHAPSSRRRHVEFQPHGLTFSRPAFLTMSYERCSLLGSLAPKRIAYVDDRFRLLEYLLSIDLFWQQEVTGRIDHFSDYVISW